MLKSSANAVKLSVSGVLHKRNKNVFGKNKTFLGDFHRFWERFWETYISKKSVIGGLNGKCKEVCRTYSPIQYAYADLLESDEGIAEFRCNVMLDGLKIGEYTSDFVCTKANGELMVRECVYRKQISKPMTVKLLDASREYWQRRGVADWGLVIDAE